MTKVLENVNFYSDVQNKKVLFAEFYNGSNMKCFAKLNSEEFRAFLQLKSLEISDYKQPLNPIFIESYLRNYFEYHGYPEKIEAFLRTAGDLEKGIAYDLKNENKQVVVIGKTGWKIKAEPKVKFLTEPTSMEQITPKRSKDSLLDLLKPFVNLQNDEYFLFVVWLVQAFCSGNHSALLVSAEKGSGKSTLSKIIRRILEPSSVDVTRLPKKTEDLLTTLSNFYVACFDNVRDITQEQSDLLCSAITASSATKRALYTDNSLCIQKLHNTVVINGITVIPKESDLAERFLVVTLKKFSSKEIRREKVFWKEFEEKLPYILGAIFDTLSLAMIQFEKLPVDNLSLPRMADAFADMLAIALALGISESDFRKIYDDNTQKMQALRSDTPIVRAVRELMDSQPSKRAIEDKAGVIHSLLRKHYAGDKKDLPGSASQLSRAMEEQHSLLYTAVS